MTSDALIIEPDRVIMRGEWATEIIFDVAYSETENIKEFQSRFEIVKGDHLADPNESFYQGVEFMALIKRKSDERLFGYPYWRPIAKYADSDDPADNGEENGIEYEWDDETDEIKGGAAWVWLPVEPFTVTGYKIADTSEENA
ncbi:hypothetical protein [Aeromicrobium sp.]|uniref:hypothetical protein n=1 Tax=Aeromicrobium sp. TaxID=1871063 RepID=UPI002FC6A539